MRFMQIYTISERFRGKEGDVHDKEIEVFVPRGRGWGVGGGRMLHEIFGWGMWLHSPSPDPISDLGGWGGGQGKSLESIPITVKKIPISD